MWNTICCSSCNKETLCCGFWPTMSQSTFWKCYCTYMLLWTLWARHVFPTPPFPKTPTYCKLGSFPFDNNKIFTIFVKLSNSKTLEGTSRSFNEKNSCEFVSGTWIDGTWIDSVNGPTSIEHDLFTRCDFIHWHVVKGNSNHMCCFINIWSNINIKIIMSCDIWQMVMWIFMHLHHHVLHHLILLQYWQTNIQPNKKLALIHELIETLCHI